MLSAFLHDPSSQKSVEEQTDYNDKINAEKPHRPRDMRVFLDDIEIEQFQAGYDSLPIDEKPIAIWRSCFEVIIRALIYDEDFSPETAAEFITNGIGSEHDMLPRIRETVSISSQAPIQIMLSIASDLYYVLAKKIFVVSMELHQMDYRSIFPQRVCAHNSSLVLKRLKDPKFTPSPEERKQYFQENKEQSFAIINSMSIWEIADLVPLESMQVLQNAGRYSLLKQFYTDDSPTNAPATKAAAALKSELKGKVL
jgi:hypothetical protein